MTARIDRFDLEQRVRVALEQPGGERLSAFAVIRDRSVTRFAGSSIHQAFDESNVRIEFRAHALHGATVLASTASLERAALGRAARHVIDGAPADARNPSSALPHNAPTVDDAGSAPATSSSTHEARADVLADAFRASPAELTFAGVFGARTLSFLYLSAATTARHARITKAYANIFAVGPNGDEGYDGAAHRDISQIDVRTAVLTAVDRAARAAMPKRHVDHGPIAAILAPDAVEELTSWAGPIGFGGKMFVEGAGFSAGRIGESLFSPSLTLFDDGASDDPAAVRMPFDCEGVAKGRLSLVEQGRLVGIAHDATTAALAGTSSTGHAAHEDVEAGPLPLHLFIEPGDAAVADLIRDVEHGLWITRFHYVNGYVNPREGAMTGLTRGGTFFIEHGRLTDPVATVRFSDRFPAIFSSIARIGRDRRLIPSWLHDAAGSVVPAIHVRALNLA